jgi:SAM-dependent methyltransferase
MDKTTKVFDSWAKAGRAEEMEGGHGVTVGKFLDSVSFDKPFSFLDIGCGNGWVVRKIAQLPKCKRAVGIDKSKNMIKRAMAKKVSNKEEYTCTSLESLRHTGKFDIIFSMESLYYSVPMEPALIKVFKMLRSGGFFYCGTDFYSDNHLTKRWTKVMKIPMDLRSKAEWRKMFKEAGFKTTSKQVKDQNHRAKWKREFGTLFMIGVKN